MTDCYKADILAAAAAAATAPAVDSGRGTGVRHTEADTAAAAGHSTNVAAAAAVEVVNSAAAVVDGCKLGQHMLVATLPLLTAAVAAAWADTHTAA